MGEIIAVLGAFSFALSHVLVKKGYTSRNQDNGTFLALLLTLSLSALFWVFWKLIFNDPVNYANPEGILWFILGGAFSTYLGRTWVYISIQRIGSVRNSAISKLNPFFTVIFAAFFIGEAMTATKAVGMLFIFCGVFIAARQSMVLSEKARNNSPEAAGLAEPDNRDVQNPQRMSKFVQSVIKSGIYYGPLSALAYALGNTFRKKGVLITADPIFGTIVGALVGTVFFLTIALFNPQYRKSVVVTFTQFNPFLFFAGLIMSLGQILYFMSLRFIEVSRATLITTLDTVFAIFISSWIFKTYESINRVTLLSALLTGIGTVIVIIY